MHIPIYSFKLALEFIMYVKIIIFDIILGLLF